MTENNTPQVTITIDAKKPRLRIFKSTIHQIGDPKFVQLMINYLDWESKWVQSRACYEVAVKHGKPVTVRDSGRNFAVHLV